MKMSRNNDCIEGIDFGCDYCDELGKCTDGHEYVHCKDKKDIKSLKKDIEILKKILKNKVKVKYQSFDGALEPIRENPKNAGFDCFTRIFCDIDVENKELIPTNNSEIILEPLERSACGLGFRTEIPEGYYAHIHSRSGNAVWYGLQAFVGTIDSGFRNEWICIITNLSNQRISLKLNQKICQFIVNNGIDVELVESKILSGSKRGLNGFGSSGD
jgi:dUTP pyrophosphatase